MYLFAGFPKVEVTGKRDEKSETGNIHDVQITPTDTLLAIIVQLQLSYSCNNRKSGPDCVDTRNNLLLIMANQLFLRPVVLTAIKVALVVGTVLALINHGPALLALELSRQQMLQIALTYLVPYGVSTYSSVKMLKNQPVRPHNTQA